MNAQLTKNCKIPQKIKTHKRSYSGQQYNEINLRKEKLSINKLQKSVCLTLTSVKPLKQNKIDLIKSLFCQINQSLAINCSLIFKPLFSVKINYVLKSQQNFDSMIKSHKSNKDHVTISIFQNQVIVQKNGVKHFHQTSQFINYQWVQIVLDSQYSVKNIEITEQKLNKVINMTLKDINRMNEEPQSKIFKPLQLIQQGNKLRALKLQSSTKKKISWAAPTAQSQNFTHKTQSIKVDPFQQNIPKQNQNNLRNCQNKLNIGSNIKKKILKDYQSDIKRKLTFDIFTKPEKSRLNQYFQENTKNIQKLQKTKSRIQSKSDKQNANKIQKLQFSKQKNILDIQTNLNYKKRKTINSNNVQNNDNKKVKEFGYMQKSIQIRRNIKKFQFF